jgi:hypothetical protein
VIWVSVQAKKSVAYVIKLGRVQIPRSSPLVIWLHIATTLIHHSGCCGRWYHHDCLQNLVSSGGTLCPVCRYQKKSRFLQLLLYIRAPLPSNLLSLAPTQSPPTAANAYQNNTKVKPMFVSKEQANTHQNYEEEPNPYQSSEAQVRKPKNPKKKGNFFSK